MAKDTAAVLTARRSRPDDVEAWLDLFTAVADEGRWIGAEVPIDREAQRSAFLEQPDPDEAAGFVVVVDGRLVGSLGIGMRKGSETGVAELWMFVAADSRGQGVGGVLMEPCLDWARAAAAHKITLTVFPHNDAARRLYSKFGFVNESSPATVSGDLFSGNQRRTPPSPPQPSASPST